MIKWIDAKKKQPDQVGKYLTCDKSGHVRHILFLGLDDVGKPDWISSVIFTHWASINLPEKKMDKQINKVKKDQKKAAGYLRKGLKDTTKLLKMDKQFDKKLKKAGIKE